MGAIGLSGIRKVFPDGTVAVDDVDLEIADGEFVVFVGPSGCGKTTLLRLISGLESATAGQLRFDGQVINEISPRERNMAMVFQNYALYPHMTVRQNIAFALRVRKFRQAEIDEAGERGRRAFSISPSFSTASRSSCPAASGNAWPWVGQSFAIQAPSFSTSLSRTWTPSSGCSCGPSCGASMKGSA